MYLPGQIIWSLTDKKPVVIGDNVWDLDSYPSGPTTHFIIHTGEWSKAGDVVKLYVPRTIEQAEALSSVGIITPAPFMIQTHCWRCRNWKTNCKALGCKEGMTKK
jgi:hypothetical protein